MIATLQQILQGALERLGYTAVTYLPPLLAGLTIMFGALVTAILIRYALARLIKAARVDMFLSESGLSSMLGGSGRLRATPLVAGTAYWAIILVGMLTALSAFNTALTSEMIGTVIFALPKLIVAGLIVLAGGWLGQYLGRSTLVWAVNEGLPSPRRLAAGVRFLIMFVAIVAAADHLNFARTVFLMAFVLVLGGAILAASIALGIGMHSAVSRRLEDRMRAEAEEEREKSLWDHL